ncbi:hypothetical protein M5689_008498 [Euphorbia peplus]|nr:hypothetical protein M5689_008498 [Euphorbia peplus]
MKNKASVFWKRMVSLVSSIAKAKAMAAKSKNSAIKARLLLFSLMKNKKLLLGSISNKIHGILGRAQDEHEYEDQEQRNNKAIVLYCSSNSMANAECSTQMIVDDYDDDDKYPDLTHCLFNEEMEEEEFNDPGGSIIDMVKHSKEEEGEDFSLEKEIDHVADLFIMRFHKQMRLQKLQSFKRLQAMLDRSL